MRLAKIDLLANDIEKANEEVLSQNSQQIHKAINLLYHASEDHVSQWDRK